MADRHLLDATPGEGPSHEDVQQLIEAEVGHGTQGISRRWQASDSDRVVLTSDSTGVKISNDNGVTPPSHVIVDGSAAGGSLTGTYPNPTLSATTLDFLVPPGVVLPYAGGGVPPGGWLFCDGTTVATAAYPRLFAAISTTYNTGGEAAGTFRLPNMLGRVALGVGGTHGLASTGGAETAPAPAHTHPGSHSHGLNNHQHGLASHTHDLNNHSHGMTHNHDISGHTHDVGHGHTLNGHTHNLDHNHALASGVAAASGAITGVHEGPSAVVNVSASNHAHDVDLPALGTTASGVPSLDSTPTMPATPSGTSSAANTGGSPTTTGGVVGSTLAAAPNVSDGVAGSTASDSSAPAASYPAPTIDTMMPFLALLYIIRAA